MDMQTNRLLHRPLLVGSVAAILISGIVIASVAISAQSFDGVLAGAPPADASALHASAAPVGHVYRCPDCGVIESARQIEGPAEQTGAGASGRMAAGKRDGIEAQSFRNYEITVRMQDGSMRVIKDPRSARWRQGEPVTIIAGADR
jgi:hypothetical protein